VRSEHVPKSDGTPFSQIQSEICSVVVVVVVGVVVVVVVVVVGSNTQKLAIRPNSCSTSVSL
jgi:hypothetical protein